MDKKTIGFNPRRTYCLNQCIYEYRISLCRCMSRAHQFKFAWRLNRLMLIPINATVDKLHATRVPNFSRDYMLIMYKLTNVWKNWRLTRYNWFCISFRHNRQFVLESYKPQTVEKKMIKTKIFKNDLKFKLKRILGGKIALLCSFAPRL